jgi:protein tyrosine phosphatase
MGCANNVNMILKLQNGTTLWLGNKSASLDIDFLKKNNIKVIVNCTKDLPFINDIDTQSYLSIETLRVPINDTSSEVDNEMLSHKLQKILPLLYNRFVKDKKNILIHCYAGVSRSASFMAAFIYYIIKTDLKKQQISFENNIHNKKSLVSNTDTMKNIIVHIRKQRPCAFFYGTKLNFKDALNNAFIDMNL